MWSLYSKTFTFFNDCLIISLLKNNNNINAKNAISKLLTVKAPRYETTPAAIITSPITLYSSLLKMSTDSAHLTFSSAKPPMSCEVTHTCEPVNVNLCRVSAYLRDPFHPNYDYPMFISLLLLDNMVTHNRFPKIIASRYLCIGITHY